PPADPATPSTGQNPVDYGMLVLARDAAGAPRLMRTLVARPGPAGASAVDAARRHVEALAPLWIASAPAIEPADQGTQLLRNGSSVVKLQQHVDGVPVHDGELHVLLGADNALSAVSGTLLAAAGRPRFGSSATAVAGRVLDRMYGTARPAPPVAELGEHGGW